jgi:peptide/nickel transport system permease protein
MIGLIVLVFFTVRLTGNPANLYLPVDVSSEVRAEFAERHGFNDPAIVQFGRFVMDLFRFDMGTSLRQQRPALTIVLEAFPTTLKLATVTMLISIMLSIFIGSWAAHRPGGVFDRIGSILSLGGASAPDFWVAIMLILLVAVRLRLLPTSGTGGFLYWVLPITVLILRPTGLITQVVRASMISALASPYIRTARAKGVGDRAILFVHALRNAGLSILTVAGDQAVGFVNGAVIVETIFGWPGVGKIMIDAIIWREFQVVQAAVVVTATAIFVMNIGIDVLYALLDPRIRHR